MKLLTLALALALALALVACNVSSTNPVLSNAGRLEPDFLLGRWNVSDVLGRERLQENDIIIAVRSDEGISLTLDGSATTFLGVATEVNSRIILSVGSQDEGWNILALSIMEDGQVITAHEMDLSIAREDVETSLIAGTVEQVDSDDFMVLLKAAGQDLADYLASRPGIFLNIPSITLTRVE